MRGSRRSRLWGGLGGGWVEEYALVLVLGGVFGNGRRELGVGFGHGIGLGVGNKLG